LRGKLAIPDMWIENYWWDCDIWQQKGRNWYHYKIINIENHFYWKNYMYLCTQLRSKQTEEDK
jgi:hypothetical protein